MARGYLLFRAVLTSIVLGLLYYVYRELAMFEAISGLLKNWVLAGVVAALISFLSMPFYFWSIRGKLTKGQENFLRVAHYSLGFLSFLFVFILVRDLFALLNLAFGNGAIRFFYGDTAFAITFLGPLLLLLLGYWQVRRGPQIIHSRLVDPRLPESFEGLKIAQISDLHICRFLLNGYVDQLLAKIEEIKPDLIVLTGDIVDGSMEDNSAEIKKLGTLTAPLGVFYVPGNHEYYWGMRQFFEAFRSYGFHTLINTSVSVRRGNSELLVCGIPDAVAGGFSEVQIDFAPLASEFRSDQYRLLLSHQPKTVQLALKHDFHLQMSGHTHGGQFFPWNWVIHFFEKYRRGLFQLNSEKHQIHLYVNQGTAYWGPPLKLGTICEVTSLVLSRYEK